MNREPEHKLLILSKHASEYQRLIEDADFTDLDVVSTSDPIEAKTLAVDCDLVFGEPILIRDVIDHLPSIHWVQATWAGVEYLLDPSLRRDYTLTNARGVFGPLMVEYVFGYLLAHERRILARYASQNVGQWDATPPGVLRGKTLGLLGVGSIGADLARTAKHFGMFVKGFTRASDNCQFVDEYYHPPDRLVFAQRLDYIVGVLPNTAETHCLVDASLLEALPKQAVFINTGRGGVVDEPALTAALREGMIAGAILDVFEEEPLPPKHVFWNTPNLIITAHTAAPSFPTDIAQIFFANYRRLLRGEPLTYQVDFERGY